MSSDDELPLSVGDIMLWYSELSVLKVCIPPEEPFFTIPMVVAKKTDVRMVFGRVALEKDESWQLTWLQGGRAQRRLLEAFYIFVSDQPAVAKRASKCKRFIVAIQYALAPSLEGKAEILDYDRYPVYSITLRPSVIPSAQPEDYLSLCMRPAAGLTYGLNISGDFTSVQALNSLSYIKVGFETMVNLFIKLLCEKGYDFTAQKDRLLCYKLFMDYCYVALDFEKELERIENLEGPLHEIAMEDGTVLELGKECIIAPEVLFDPGLVGLDEDSILAIFEPTGNFIGIPNSFILAGGCAPRLKGLSERIQQEIMNDKIADSQFNIIKANIREDALRWYEA